MFSWMAHIITFAALLYNWPDGLESVGTHCVSRGVVKAVPVILVAFLVEMRVTAFRSDIDLLDP